MSSVRFVGCVRREKVVRQAQISSQNYVSEKNVFGKTISVTKTSFEPLVPVPPPPVTQQVPNSTYNSSGPGNNNSSDMPRTQTTPLTETIKTAALISTAGGSMFITPSDVMITMQVLEVALCRNARGMSLLYPVISLGRLIRPWGNADDKDSENETSMILVTIGLVYLLHGLLTVALTFMNTFTLQTWVTRVIHLRYPALSIRYH
eukprot:PhF_6_TR4457/c0_g2_i1/m.6047